MLSNLESLVLYDMVKWNKDRLKTKGEQVQPDFIDLKKLYKQYWDEHLPK
jgi:hypothetical protein